LIIAEAAFQTSDKATATTAQRACALQQGADRESTLTDIMTEEVHPHVPERQAWNDYKRTCLPALKPARISWRSGADFLYGSTEMQTNTNAPAVEPPRHRSQLERPERL
jgi:hypothetical protein